MWNEGNCDFLDEVTAGDYVYHELTDEVFVGVETMQRNVATVREAFPDIHFTAKLLARNLLLTFALSLVIVRPCRKTERESILPLSCLNIPVFGAVATP